MIFDRQLDKTLYCILYADKELREPLINILINLPQKLYDILRVIISNGENKHYYINDIDENKNIVYDLYKVANGFMLYKEVLNEHGGYEAEWCLSLIKNNPQKPMRNIGRFFYINDYPGKSYDIDFSPIGEMVLANGKPLQIVNLYDIPEMTLNNLQQEETFTRKRF